MGLCDHSLDCSIALNNIFIFETASASLGLPLIKCLTWSQKDGNNNKAWTTELKKHTLELISKPSGMLLFLWLTLTIGGTFYTSIFNLLGVLLKLVLFGCFFTFRWSFIYWFVWFRTWSHVLAWMCYFATTEIRLRNQNCNCLVVIFE